MFRRIETVAFGMKIGIWGVVLADDEDAADALCDLPGPKNHHKNCRFYFTELGWNRYGRRILQGVLRCGQQVQVKTVKENSVEVMWKDKWQVAVRPRKPKAVLGSR